MILFGGVQKPEAGGWIHTGQSLFEFNTQTAASVFETQPRVSRRGLNRRQKINLNLEAGREVGSWMLEI